MQAKMETIDAMGSGYKLKDIYEGLQKGKTIPTSAMQDALESVENFKTKRNAKDLGIYIDKLEDELASEQEDVKGNKAKDKQAKIVAQLQAELDFAKMMLYLDSKLIDEIGNNYQFKKNNSPTELKVEYERVSEEYARLTQKDNLIKTIQGLRDTEQYKEAYNLQADKQKNLAKVSTIMDNMIDTSLDVCKDEFHFGLEKDVQNYGRIGAKILYNWTLLNEMNPESMTNWQQLLQIIPSDEADEGTIYRYIMQTADLISQMGEIASVGEAGAKTEEDKKYYSELKDACSYTRELLIQDPVIV